LQLAYLSQFILNSSVGTSYSKNDCGRYLHQSRIE